MCCYILYNYIIPYKKKLYNTNPPSVYCLKNAKTEEGGAKFQKDKKGAYVFYKYIYPPHPIQPFNISNKKYKYCLKKIFKKILD